MSEGLRDGWWEDYSCGCESDYVPRKKDLLGYCGRHGNDRRNVYPPAKVLQKLAEWTTEPKP